MSLLKPLTEMQQPNSALMTQPSEKLSVELPTNKICVANLYQVVITKQAAGSGPLLAALEKTLQRA